MHDDTPAHDPTTARNALGWEDQRIDDLLDGSDPSGSHSDADATFDPNDHDGFGRVIADLQSLAARDGDSTLRPDLEAKLYDLAIDVDPFTVRPQPVNGSYGASVRGILGWTGWLTTAMLGIALLNNVGPTVNSAGNTTTIDAAAIAELKERPTAMTIAWEPASEDAATQATGSIVWDSESQTGAMTFDGLAINDPEIEQYQLWIFDAEQDERYPIDGGVFNIAKVGEAIVPIDAKLQVERPTLFAITIEKPGGVVVSSRERLPLLAKVPDAS